MVRKVDSGHNGEGLQESDLILTLNGKIITRASLSDAASEYGESSEASSSGYILQSRNSVPPTPDLIHSNSGTFNRSSTSMSIQSSSSALGTPDRQSMQSHWRTTLDENIPEVPTKILRSGSDTVDDAGVVGDFSREETTKYSTSGLEHRSGMRLS